MNLLNRKMRSAEESVREVGGLAALREFLAPDCGGLMVRRQTPPYIQDWFDDLAPEYLPRGRTVLLPHKASDWINRLCDEAKTPPGLERQWLRKDVGSLAANFAEVMGAHRLRLRLDVIETNACRKFHVDAITARLICTYRGTGTQYGTATANRDPGEIFTVPTGVPFLLRGSLSPPTPPSGLVHRSPPIEGTGETRLVLVLDPVTARDDEI